MLRARLLSPSILNKLRYPANSSRAYSQHVKNVSTSLGRRRTVARTALLGITAASTVLVASTIYADSDDGGHMAPNSLGSLVRAYTVYSMCSVPALVDASPKILSVLSSVPGVRQITEAFVRVTFFDQVCLILLCFNGTRTHSSSQFVGADSAEEAIPLLKSLRAANRGVLFAYSVEVDENEASGASSSRSAVASHTFPTNEAQKQMVAETIHCIDVAADFESNLRDSKDHDLVARSTGRRTWVAVKMTALVPDASALIALSSYIIESRNGLKGLPESSIPFPGSARTEDLDVLSKPSSLSPFHVHCIRELYSNLHRICSRAREKGVKVIVDAEYRCDVHSFTAGGPVANSYILVVGTNQRLML